MYITLDLMGEGSLEENEYRANPGAGIFISDLLLFSQDLLQSAHILSQLTLSPVQFGERSNEVSRVLECL